MVFKDISFKKRLLFEIFLFRRNPVPNIIIIKYPNMHIFIKFFCDYKVRSFIFNMFLSGKRCFYSILYLYIYVWCLFYLQLPLSRYVKSISSGCSHQSRILKCVAAMSSLSSGLSIR